METIPARRAKTGEGITVRRAKTGEASSLAEFQAAMAEETEDKTLDVAKVTRGCEHMLQKPELGFYLVAEIDRRLVGMCAITYEWSDWRNGLFWWIQDVFVEAEYRKRGVFRCLFDELRREARADPNVAGLRLYHEVDNAAAHEVYLKCGLKDTHYQMMEEDFSAERHGSPNTAS
mmetsp:Transcript_5635/g.16765  ORF Transcript_5635/g.16765 Transcript_5635/m.16765 type:complete len:175 (-) Transcript_5635:245-769(-)